MVLALALAILATLLLPAKTISFVQEVQAEEVETRVSLHPALIPVCACESSYEGNRNGTPRHYETDGVTVRRGRANAADVGMCQINLFYHVEAAEKMDIDLLSEEGNIKYANHLYEKQGLKPWVWSKPCWGKK
jgi:hypothetical protein